MFLSSFCYSTLIFDILQAPELMIFLYIILAICLKYTCFSLPANSSVRKPILCMPKYWCSWYPWSRNFVIVIYWLFVSYSDWFSWKIVKKVVFSWSRNSKKTWMHLFFSPKSISWIVRLQYLYATLFVIVSWTYRLITFQFLLFFSIRYSPFRTIFRVNDLITTHTWSFLIGKLWV